MDDGSQAADGAEHHTAAEFSAAWDNMSRGDLLRLRKAAALFQRGPMLAPLDLFQEVYVRVLRGTRPWPREEGLVPFIIGVMRSVADEFGKRAARGRSIVAVGAEGTAGEATTDLTDKAGRVVIPLNQPRSPEEDMIAAQEAEEEGKRLAGWREQVLSCFADDYVAQLMVEGMLDSQKGAQLKELVGLSDKEFASKHRKVRRRIEKLQEEVQTRKIQP